MMRRLIDLVLNEYEKLKQERLEKKMDDILSKEPNLVGEVPFGQAPLGQPVPNQNGQNGGNPPGLNGQTVMAERDAYKTPYDRNFISAIKFYIPQHCRTWDKAKKSWIVEREYADVMSVLCGRSFDKRESESGMIDWYLAWDILHLRSSAPLELIDTAVKLLLELRPDRINQIHIARLLIEQYGNVFDLDVPNQSFDLRS